MTEAGTSMAGPTKKRLWWPWDKEGARAKVCGCRIPGRSNPAALTVSQCVFGPGCGLPIFCTSRYSTTLGTALPQQCSRVCLEIQLVSVTWERLNLIPVN